MVSVPVAVALAGAQLAVLGEEQPRENSAEESLSLHKASAQCRPLFLLPALLALRKVVPSFHPLLAIRRSPHRLPIRGTACDPGACGDALGHRILHPA